MTAPSRPVLRYHGGKWRLAPWIIQHFPPHRVYVEPFGGGGSVLMRKPRSYAEVYNDVWQRVVDVFRVLRDPGQALELERAIQLTPYARAEFEATGEDDLAAIPDVVERSRRLILRSFGGHGSAAVCGRHSTGFRANTTRSGTTPAEDWRNWPDCIPAFVDRLRGVTIECRPAADVIADHDAPATLHYVDPPYVQATRNMKRGNATYAADMDDAAHRVLAEQLRGLAGMVVLSGYRCDLYDEVYGDWARVETVGLTDAAQRSVECLWLNPACAAALANNHGPLFDLQNEAA